MKKEILMLGCAVALFSQLSYAGLTIDGGINNNTGSGGSSSVDVGIGVGASGANGVGVSVNNPSSGNSSSQKPAASSQLQKDIYASICSSPFMKKYASICQ